MFDERAEGSPSPGEPGGGTSTLERRDTEIEFDQQLDQGDHDLFAHYVRKEDILTSAVTGKPVLALCGKKWTPGRDPEKFPVCPTCQEIYEMMQED